MFARKRKKQTYQSRHLPRADGNEGVMRNTAAFSGSDRDNERFTNIDQTTRDILSCASTRAPGRKCFARDGEKGCMLGTQRSDHSYCCELETNNLYLNVVRDILDIVRDNGIADSKRRRWFWHFIRDAINIGTTPRNEQDLTGVQRKLTHLLDATM